MDTAAILTKALDQERKYNWLGAAEAYEKALGELGRDDISEHAVLRERLGYAFYRAAMQASSVEEFRNKIPKAISNYERARDIAGKSDGEKERGGRLRCEAMVAHLSSWLESQAVEKKRLLDDAWTLTRQALEAFTKAGSGNEYAQTYDRLSIVANLAFALEWNFQAREKMVREALKHGEQTIKLLVKIEDPQQLARAYAKTAVYLGSLGRYFVEPSDREGYDQRALGYWRESKKLSEETALLELLSPSPGVDSFESFGIVAGSDESLRSFEMCLEFAKKAKDGFLIGNAFDWLAYHHAWKADGTEDPESRKGQIELAVRYAEEAGQAYATISFSSPRGDWLWVGSPDLHHYAQLARLETDPKKKRELLEKALEVAPDLLKRGADSGYPGIITYAHWMCSRPLIDSAKMEAKPEDRNRLLEQALGHMKETIKIIDQTEPLHYFNRGVMRNDLGNIEFELAELAKDPEVRRKRLEEAVRDKKTAIETGMRDIPTLERTGSILTFEVIARYENEYGDFLNRLYGFTGNVNHLRDAVEAYIHAAKLYAKPDLRSRKAESYWKAAQAYDALGEYLKSAEAYLLAAENYAGAEEKIPQLKKFYRDHAQYMQAWSEIEKARYHHARQEYDLAKTCYVKAADLHESTSEWGSLASNYSAWARLENAEDLSRKEQSKEAIQEFRGAAELFREGAKSLQTKTQKIETDIEGRVTESLIRAAALRADYCTARIRIEEAKLLDRKDDHYASSESYTRAAEILEKIAGALESEEERREIKLIMLLSTAWSIMARAEGKASPDLYADASRLFEEAKTQSSNEKTSTLTLGHSRFCKALEAGARFVDSGDTSQFTHAVQHLESAIRYYVGAGFQDAAEYAGATRLLFDAYLQMNKAAVEENQENRVKLYAMAAKLLQESADSYSNAGQLGKRERVLRLLEKVKKERELALSLTELLHAPSILSNTEAFTTPTPTRERAVGIERFEHANIQASMIADPRSLKVGENLELEIELVNAGRGPAQLIKVEELVPEGFELREKPESYRVEGSYLNMKGRRLDALKTEEVKLVLEPKIHGVFTIRPRILYLDEDGKYRSHEPEPVEITVRELGVSGWIRGR